MFETSDTSGLTGAGSGAAAFVGDLRQSRAAASAFERDLTDGLSARPRRVAPKYFYDAAGSALFDRICELPEYYPTRTERAILERHAPAIAEYIGPRADIVEFGAGSLSKIRLLLDAFESANAPRRFFPIHI